MRERLVSYLLGELSPDEAAQIERQVEADPKLQDQLEHLRRCLFAEEDAGDDDQLPRGLADRTADSVHDLVLGLESPNSEASGGDWSPTPDEAPAASCRFTLVDAGVAVGVIMALGMMLLPALQESRSASRRLACQNNLSEISRALELYAAQHGGFLPHIEPGQNAGMFALKLAQDELLDRDQLSRLIVCAASPLAEQVASGKVGVRVPTPDEMRAADPGSLASLRRYMGGSYAYRLGYLDKQLYMPICRGSKSGSPILSDAPNPTACGKWQSMNHGGCGQNVLFQDGSVAYRTNCLLSCVDDNFFANNEGAAAAGRRWNDAVLVSSSVTPGVLPMVQPPKRVVGYLQIRTYRRPMPQEATREVGPLQPSAPAPAPTD